MKTNEAEKGFDCVKMKNDIQAKIYAEIKDMHSSEKIAYFKEAECHWQSQSKISAT
jgi:hypothetical protein